jgi:hypothetical protein
MRRAFAVVVIAISIPSSAFGQRLLADGTKELADQIAATASKEQKRRIAVASFHELDGRVTVLGAYLAESLTTRLFGAAGFEIIERSLLDKVMVEMKLGATGLIDPTTAAKVGKIAVWMQWSPAA